MEISVTASSVCVVVSGGIVYVIVGIGSEKVIIIINSVFETEIVKKETAITAKKG